MHTGGMKQQPQLNFQKLVNRNAIKAKIGDPLAIFLESLDPSPMQKSVF
jgi:hypothetical protein